MSRTLDCCHVHITAQIPDCFYVTLFGGCVFVSVCMLTVMSMCVVGFVRARWSVSMSLRLGRSVLLELGVKILVRVRGFATRCRLLFVETIRARLQFELRGSTSLVCECMHDEE